ncbi:LPD7 domain-containing protein [Microvirgula aerodenitrificans]|uniref:LPD7 domain-containing protein n=1 Tax=Microvirgula aerodenitrificans TaxID=57480 RepID=UPI00248EE8CC|nr:LPD7 domain-containing protein [Microvirgula aerodenitrificans]
MVDTFDVVAGGKATRYTNAEEAGKAFFLAKSMEQPSVIHGMPAGPKTGPSGRARILAETVIDGRYDDGGTRYVKSVPLSNKAVDKAFRTGYVEALEKSVAARLQEADWDAAKAASPSATPKLDPRLYDDLSHLSKNDFERATRVWEEHAPEGTKSPTFVDRSWKRQNEEARQLAAVLDASERGPAYGVMSLNDKPVTSIRFERSELDGEQAFNVSFHMGNKTVARLKGVDADTLADAVGEKNAKTIMDHGDVKGSLKAEALANEYGLTPEENTRREAMKEARKAVELIQLEQREPDADDEKNVVEMGQELEIIDGKEAVARANLVRQREREQREREQEALGIKAEEKRIDVENLSEQAMDQDDANDIAARSGGIPDRDSQEYTEQEKNRQVELMEQVHNQFRVAGTKFYFKDQPGKLAMKDKGERMVTASNDDRVAKAMATMAEAKGWKTIKVSGHPEFQREVWMEANLRGISVRGYKPTEQDLKQLEAKRERAMHNSVEHDPTARERKPEQQHQEASRKTDSASRQEPVAAKKSAEQGGDTQEPGKAANAPLRAYAGRVIEHGAAPYNHDPEESANYFVRLKTNEGEKTVWGIDLQRAMSDSQVKSGDDVSLEYRGSMPVTVAALKRDQAGKVIGKEEILTNRNQWDVHKSDKALVAESVASAFIDAKVPPAHREVLKAAVGARITEREQANRVPAVPVYDKSAPAHSQQQERTGPVVERNSERTR